jgi:hypothetical protein
MEKIKRLQFYDSEQHKPRLSITGAFLAKLHLLTATRYCPFIENYIQHCDWQQPFFISLLRAYDRAEARGVSGTTWSVWEMPVVAFTTYDCSILVTEIWTVAPLHGFRPQLPARRKAPDLIKALLSSARDSVQLLIAPPTIAPARLPFVQHVARPKRPNNLRLWPTRPIESTTNQPLSLEHTLNLIREANLWLQNKDAV